MTDASWQRAATAADYVAFCARFGRYTDSSRWLVAALHRHITAEVTARGLRGLDWAAGTGATTQAWAERVSTGEHANKAEITAWEPSPAMAQRHPATGALRGAGVRWRLRPALSPPGGRGFDAVVGNSMWWLLHDPVTSLIGLSPWLAPDAVLAWSTPVMYCGVPPGDAEIRLSVALNDARVAAKLPLDASPSHGGWAGPLDPAAALTTAGWRVLEETEHTRACSPEEWLAHTMLPPVRPPWLRSLPPGALASFVRHAAAALVGLSDYPQTWRITVARGAA